ncbi:MAG TPA: mandelate racemase/muconate lactonizing enzyme family protein [Planctomycetota bacterium]|nr:mandelate racemase/muconate lactonizing enzyme family protein [Planctomycetota bacterium]
MSGRLGRDVRIAATTLRFIPLEMRMPLKFGRETVTSVTYARASVRVEAEGGGVAEGWGETPLSVQWVWPSTISEEERRAALKELSTILAAEWAEAGGVGHALDVGHAFLEGRLPQVLRDYNAMRAPREPMPHLAALVCASAFDIALHDAYGNLNGLPVYETYGPGFLGDSLARYLEPAEGALVSFKGKSPADYLQLEAPESLPAWHLVGGKDPLEAKDLDGTEPDDGHPVLLRDWIRRDGLDCLKVKLRGNDDAWDFERLERVGTIALEEGARWLSADFNCTVTDPAYVNAILDRLQAVLPRIHAMLLYVEQPFPHDLEEHRIDVHSVSARKPLFMDESAHDWRLVRLGRSLGWTGVALKTCKTQTGALLSLAWARAHGMALMVQDLTNAMLAQIPHVLLAAHARTILGVETNAMQFYPEASRPEAEVHPGLYTRRNGRVDLTSLKGPGFGYRLAEIRRELPPPDAAFG